MSRNGDRVALLEAFGRLYAEHGFAVVWTRGLEGDAGKSVTTRAWQTTQPLSDREFAAGLFATRGLTRNPAITARTSGLVLLDCDTPEGLAEIEALGLPTSWVVQSSAEYKRHFYYRQPPGIEQLPFVGFRFEAAGFSADLNRYLVAPPAIHPDTGIPYALLTEPELAIAEMPSGVYVALCERGSHEESRRRERIAVDGGAKFKAGTRGDALFRFACQQRRWYGENEAAILAATIAYNAAMCDPPIERERVESQVRGAMKLEGGQELARANVSGQRAAEPVPVKLTAGARIELEELVETFRRWLHLPDPGALYVTLASVVANRLPGDPVWLLLVAPSSAGKTEVLFSLGGLPEVEPAATLTEASLLSGVPRKEHAAGATGGLLRKVGEYGILTLKDFGSVLSMQRDARAGVLAALRECYDGSWDRPVGVDGGKTLHWEGKLGLIAGVTTVVDRHHAVMDALGSRFAFYRIEVDERKAQTRRALEHVRRTRGMRAELREGVAAFFAGLELADDVSRISDSDTDRLVSLADFVTQARSPVERDAYSSREIELVPEAEAPARFASMLASLLDGFRLVGLDDTEAWRLVVKVALDSMPAARRKVVEYLVDTTGTTTTKDVATLLGLPTTTARRTLEDLAAHGVVTRHSAGEGKADMWALSPAARDDYRLGTVPEMSVSHPSNTPHTVQSDISGKVSERP